MQQDPHQRPVVLRQRCHVSIADACACAGCGNVSCLGCGSTLCFCCGLCSRSTQCFCYVGTGTLKSQFQADLVFNLLELPTKSVVVFSYGSGHVYQQRIYYGNPHIPYPSRKQPLPVYNLQPPFSLDHLLHTLI